MSDQKPIVPISAELLIERADAHPDASAKVELYRPSSGTAGADFAVRFCNRCKLDANEDCSIYAATFAYDIDDPGYPKEWRYVNGAPTCTAFDPVPLQSNVTVTFRNFTFIDGRMVYDDERTSPDRHAPASSSQPQSE